MVSTPEIVGNVHSLILEILANQSVPVQDHKQCIKLGEEFHEKLLILMIILQCRCSLNQGRQQ